MSECQRDHFYNSQPVAAAVGVTLGTLIETDSGPRLVETLELGDLIETLDNGFQPLRSLARQRMRGTAGSAPIRIAAGVIGNTMPLVLAPHHRVLITGWQAELYFGQDEILIEAISLLNGSTVIREYTAHIEYIGLGFNEHQIIVAQDALIESDVPHHSQDFIQAMSPRRLETMQDNLVRPAIIGTEAAVLTL